MEKPKPRFKIRKTSWPDDPWEVIDKGVIKGVNSIIYTSRTWQDCIDFLKIRGW